MSEACPFCPDGHRDPLTTAWSAWVSTQRDADQQPVAITVMPSDGRHVAESDAEWIRGLMREAAGA